VIISGRSQYENIPLFSEIILAAELTAAIIEGSSTAKGTTCFFPLIVKFKLLKY